MPHVRQSHPPGLSIAAAAQQLGCAPRTVRRWLQTGHLQGTKIGQRTWLVLLPPEAMAAPATAVEDAAQCAAAAPAVVRQRLRDVGAQLITVGNRVAQAIPRAGVLFLTWRAPRSLRVTLAIGRVSQTQRWAPHALGVELPFWLDERAHWHRVLPLLRRYDTLRACCRPWLLRLPGVGAAILEELTLLEAAVIALGKVNA